MSKKYYCPHCKKLVDVDDYMYFGSTHCKICRTPKVIYLTRFERKVYKTMKWFKERDIQ